MRRVERFVKLIKGKFNIELDPNTFRRVHAGHWQRSQGAWSWSMRERNTVRSYGSAWSLTELMKAKELETFIAGYGEVEFIPTNKIDNSAYKEKP